NEREDKFGQRRRMYAMGLMSVFFFFQAEDGIRDRNVTGVQTCALPISQSNLEIETPERYFLASGTDVKDEIQKQELIPPFKKGILGDIIAEVFKRFKITETSKMLDRMKDLGFYYSTRAGMTVGVSDIVVLSEKETMLEEAQVKADNVLKQFRRGLITDEERYDRVIAIWSDAKDVIQDKLMESLSNSNPIYMMSDSGARGN